jgi:hypothetical protein
VKSGTNGNCNSYLCNAVEGYDGPTGLGTPNGQSILAASGGGSRPPNPCAGHDSVTYYVPPTNGGNICVATTYYCNPLGEGDTEKPQVAPPGYDQSLGGSCQYNGWSRDPNNPYMWQENFCKPCNGDCSKACHAPGPFPPGT